MRDDQMVFTVHRRLHVVADDACAATAGRHRARVRISQGHLLIGCSRKLLADTFELFSSACGQWRSSLLGAQPVHAIEFGKITCDALLQLLLSGFELMRREVLVPVVHRLELAAIDHYERLAEEPDAAAQLDELGAYLADRRTVVPAEVGDRLEVRRETPR